MEEEGSVENSKSGPVIKIKLTSVLSHPFVELLHRIKCKFQVKT